MRNLLKGGQSLLGARALALAAALAASLALSMPAAALGGVQTTKPRAAKPSAKARFARPTVGRRAKRVVRLSRRTASRQHEKKRDQPAPEPAPSPTPEPESTPEPAPAPAPEPEPEPAPTPSGSLLFRGDFDSGFDGWYVQSLSSRIALFSSGAYQGTQACRFEVREGDVEPDTGSQRSEVSGPTFDEGQDLYIRDAIRIGRSYSYQGPWQIIEQLHEENWSGSPGMAVFLDPGPALRLGAGDGSPTFWRGPTLDPQRWYDLIYRVKLSRSSSTGFVEVWLNGVQQVLTNGQTRVYGQTIQAAQTYLKAGIYRSRTSTGTSLVEHDAIRVGTSYAAVAGG